MLLKFILKLKNSRSVCKPIYCPSRVYQFGPKMENVYIRHMDGAEQFQVSFQLRDESLGLDRQFNFSRQLSEKVNDFLGRVTANIERSLNKKKKKKKRNPEDQTEGEDNKINVTLLQAGNPVPGDQECKDVIFGNRLSLKILNSELSIIVNAPWVNLITLPSSIMAGFPVYPLKFETMFAQKAECSFSWYKNSGILKGKNMPVNWTEVGRGYYYTPTSSDIGSYLKLVCAPRNGDVVGPSSDVVSTNPVEAGPGLCPFELRHAFTRDRLDGKSFRVVTYNILADLYADSDVAKKELYPYCPSYALSIDYRKQLILKEILGYNGDIICLQEVDSKVFDNDLLPTLSSIGYNGVFNKKGGTVSEGLACLFHESRFRCVASHIIHLGEELKSNPLFSDIWNKVRTNEALAARISDRTTCSQFVVLDSVDNPKERVIIANTHQYFHPDADHIRLLQTGMTVMYLEHLVAENIVSDKEKRVSYIFCGDFNSTPEWGVYRFITTQHIPEDCIDWASNKEEEVKRVSLSHSLQFSSACGTPEFTNYTVGFAGCLDYIFYQNNQFEVIQVVPLPSTEEFQQHIALPSIVFPSDHIALVADLAWK